jgi:signal transduction histidine kinase
MARKTPARLVAAAVSGALHLLALLQFFAHKDQYGLPPEWTRDFSLLLGLSLLLLVVIHGMPSLRVRVAAAVVKIVAFLIVGVPFGAFLDIRYILMFSLLLDMSFCFSPPADTILSSAVMAGSVVFLVPISAFSVSMASPRFLDWSSFFFIGASFMLLLSLARRLSERDTENTARIKSLNEFITKLLSTSRDYLEYAARVERESTENERNRITQELHDVVGQAFTNIYAMMDASLKHPPSSPAETGELHTWAKEQAQKGLNETYAVLPLPKLQ